MDSLKSLEMIRNKKPSDDRDIIELENKKRELEKEIAILQDKQSDVVKTAVNRNIVKDYETKQKI